jgi:UDP:flavonoid glycosyltransferase YjiC (YdhE family)
MSQTERKCILFIAEAVTLAHVARPLVLAQSLDPAQYEIHFACAKRFNFAFEKTNFRRWEVNSIPSEQFLRALASGSRLYNYRTLEHYVDDDLRIIRDVRPDLIVGDFRLSLAVSAAVAKVPYAALTNAYWSPYSVAKSFPLPGVPISRILGYHFSNSFFQLTRPLIFAYHAQPLNRLRKKYGFPELGSLLDVYTYGDYTLYADPPEFIPTQDLPANHRFLGHIDWSPEIPLPDWWTNLPPGTPVVYVNLGSSGPAYLLPIVIAALDKLPVTVIMATAGRWQPTSLPANVQSCDYLPGNDAVRRATLVICNGGSPSVYQALGHGVPVIGIADNMDQLLSMQAAERNRTGILLRAANVTEKTVQDAVLAITRNENYKKNVHELRDQLARMTAVERFQSFVSDVLATKQKQKQLRSHRS